MTTSNEDKPGKPADKPVDKPAVEFVEDLAEKKRYENLLLQEVLDMCARRSAKYSKGKAKGVQTKKERRQRHKHVLPMRVFYCAACNVRFWIAKTGDCPHCGFPLRKIGRYSKKGRWKHGEASGMAHSPKSRALYETML